MVKLMTSGKATSGFHSNKSVLNDIDPTDSMASPETKSESIKERKKETTVGSPLESVYLRDHEKQQEYSHLLNGK